VSNPADFAKITKDELRPRAQYDEAGRVTRGSDVYWDCEDRLA